MFRNVADFLKRADPKPSKAELALIEACKWGRGHTVKDGTLPPDGTPDPDIIVRASLLRLLIMGGTPECGLHESGVWLTGAYISGILDLRFARTSGQLALTNCRIVAKLRLDDARVDMLTLDGSDLPDGLFADRIKVSGGIFLRGTTARGNVSLAGAEVGGTLACESADFQNAGGDALNADSVKVTGHVILHKLTTKGEVSLLGAEIGGQIECDGADFQNASGKALNAQGMRVLGGFFFRKINGISGLVDLNSAYVCDLTDDTASWEMCSDLILDGFTYDRLQGNNSPRSFKARHDWLGKGSVFEGNFSPQPYTQLAKVFRAAGDLGEARKVLMERDRLLGIEARKANLNALTAARAGAPWDVGQAWLKLHLAQGWDWLTRQVIGYGHAPQRALWVALGLIGAGAVLFFLAWQAGVMVPNSAVILTSDDWLKAMADPALRPPHAWMGLPSATHYETFYSLPYALDVFLPLVSIGQENAWAATTDIGFGKVIRWFTFAYQIAGWVVTSLGIAAITGFVQPGSPD